MQITRNSIKTMAGPSEWFTGAVYVDTVATPVSPSRLSASSVHFSPGARTAWHTHPNGQTIFVTEGIGLFFKQRWAEYLTVGVTASFIPVEIIESIRHFGPLKLVLLAVNLLIVASLVRILRADAKTRRME